MRRSVIQVMVMLWALLATGWAQAATAPNPLRVEQASSPADALTRVLQRVTGGHLDTGIPFVKMALAKPDDYVQPEPGTRNMVADANALGGLLARAGSPIWLSPRPGLIFWIQDNERATGLIPGDSTTEWPSRFMAAGNQWALPVAFPLIDLDDLAHVTPDIVQQGLVGPIMEAGKRYGDYWPVVGQMTHDGDAWQLQWQLLDGSANGAALIKGVAKGSQDDVTNKMFADVADYLATRFSKPVTLQETPVQAQSSASGAASTLPALTPGWNNGSLDVQVSGLASFADVLALQTLLQSWPSVAAVSIVALDGDTAVVRLQAKGDAAQLVAALQADAHLTGSAAAPFVRQWHAQP